MAQNYEIDIKRFNGQDYDTLLPTPAAHASTHQAGGSDPITVKTGNIENSAVTATKIASGAVQTAKIADGAVTRAKLAKDALYSPLEQKTSNYTLTSDDIGKTFYSDSASPSDVRVITLSETNSDSMPIGSEIAIVAGNTGTAKLTVEAGIGVRGNKDGDIISSNGITVTIPRYGMIALKKFYAKYWLITGVFEVDS